MNKDRSSIFLRMRNQIGKSIDIESMVVSKFVGYGLSAILFVSTGCDFFKRSAPPSGGALESNATEPADTGGNLGSFAPLAKSPKMDFVGIELGYSLEELKSKIDSTSCGPLILTESRQKAGGTGIYCKQPHQTVREAEFSFYKDKLYWAVFFFEGKYEDLGSYHQGILAKFNRKFKNVGFRDVDLPSRIIASCTVRGGDGSGCRSFAWVEGSKSVVYVAHYEHAVGLVLRDQKLRESLESKANELELNDGMQRAKNYGF